MIRSFESHPAPQVRFCTCGQAHSPNVYDKHAHSVNGQLVRCHACDLENIAFISHRHLNAGIDVVCRYIRRFGGSTFQVQTDIDNSDIYLRNTHGQVIARVSMVNRFNPKKYANLDNMPY